MTKKFYLTTAIDYVNAVPHIGHAFEKVLADAIARWHRIHGEKVWFLTGTDENAQKNGQAAKEAGIPVREFVDKNSKFFIQLCKELNLSNDDFIRTTEKRHVKICQEIIEKANKRGDIYKGSYEGLYCSGCEGYKTEKDLVNGKCPEHPNRPITTIKEDAYFFKLSKYKKQIEKFVKDYIIPEARKKEILSRLKEEELKDLCITRKGGDWGIDFPLDKNFKIYVWFDALVNYISGSNGNWPAELHIVGKGINWFHSVIWPAILLSSGYELPKNLLVHGYLTYDGQKISKSLGNVIDPVFLVKKYGTDAVRYSLLRGSVFEDADFTEKVLVERYNNELANKLGNLISRFSTLAEKYGIEKTENKLIKKLKLKEIEKYFEKYEIDKALNLIFSFIDSCNEYIQDKKPWETQDKKVLYEIADSIKAAAILLWPFIPSSSEKIAKQFGFEIKYDYINKPLKENNIKKGEILFKRIE
jgi:methionyl-tRNA synthetase